MRTPSFPLPASLLAVLPVLAAACSAPPPKRFKAERLEAETPSQQQQIKKVEDLFWVGGEEFDALIAECAKDPAVAQKLTMLMLVHMDDTERNQRRRQGTDFQLRTLEDNVPYVRARNTIVALGPAAVPVIEELIRHPRMEARRRGVEVLAAMPASALPGIETKFAACPERYRRHYAEAVAGMRPSPQAELLLLRWSKDPDFTVRAAALAGLSVYGDRHRALMWDAIRSDPDPFVRRQVVKSLGAFGDRQTAAAVIASYERASESNDRRGMQEAERTLVKISKLPASHDGRLIRYGLAHWQKWVLTMPVDGEVR